MTQEEKDLLLKDFCARLSYGITIYRITDNSIHRIQYSDITENIDQFSHFLEYSGIDNIKPYLRPMLSMTMKEEEWLTDRINFSRDDEVDKVRQKWGIVMQEIDINSNKYVFSNFTEILDWLNAHHFDYRGLIEKGLALPAPEGMYK